MLKIISKSFEETRKLGQKMAKSFQGGEVICLSGDLGAGKTTFTQGILEELGAKKPFVSPTFMIMKEYILENPNSKFQISNKIQNPKSKIKKVYHIDTYRVTEKDILDLGWEEMIADKKSVIIVEWPERIKNIIPERAKWIEFKWLGEKERGIEMNF